MEDSVLGIRGQKKHGCCGLRAVTITRDAGYRSVRNRG